MDEGGESSDLIQLNDQSLHYGGKCVKSLATHPVCQSFNVKLNDISNLHHVN